MKNIILLVCGFVVFFKSAVSYFIDYEEVSHQITVNHPGEKAPVQATLIQILGKNRTTIGYKMDVVSVICLEQVCKVIPVTIYWDAVGNYQKYDIEKGQTLEKYEADVFAPEDYTKLHRILSDKQSPFKEVLLSEVLTVVVPGQDDVDAVSGATALKLDEKDTVPGAALTCYTLWHWVNGGLIPIIKDITGKTASYKQLLQFLNEESRPYFEVALKELARRQHYETSLVNLIISKSLMYKKDSNPTLDFFENGPKQVFQSALYELFVLGDKSQRIAVLQSFKNTSHHLNSLYLERLSEALSQTVSFQEISIFLQLIEENNVNSEAVNEALKPFLETDFLIARRVYWYLNTQLNLNKALRDEVQAFRLKYANKL
ncbi:hypothetical protein [Pseudotamlana carrageenivorans]|uniref:hypothetical protein n=1 Tax=Pseudotamlana carrageenivorans TaxID=2069432 RepID=UPI0013152CDE|nr:hypothetical protein [Tamlana carrageenivorans]